MKILILAAGYGTRLQSVAKNTPKPLLPVGPKPLIDYIVEKVAPLAAVSEIVVVTNNKFYDTFTTWTQTHKSLPVRIRIVNDGTNTPEERLGSVGDIRFVWNNEKTKEDWLVVGGDNILTDSLGDFMRLAQSKNQDVTVGTYDIGNIQEATKFGVVKLAADKKMTELKEKPAQPESSLIAMCLYHFPKSTLGLIDEYVNGQNTTDAAGGYIQWLVAKKCVYGFQFGGKWYDIGSLESLQEANNYFNRPN